MGKVVSIKKFLNYDDMVKMENDLEKRTNGQDYWKLLVLGLIVNLLEQRKK